MDRKARGRICPRRANIPTASGDDKHSRGGSSGGEERTNGGGQGTGYRGKPATAAPAALRPERLKPPHLSAKADIAQPEPRIHSPRIPADPRLPGPGLRSRLPRRALGPSPRGWSRQSAKADFVWSLLRIHSPQPARIEPKLRLPDRARASPPRIEPELRLSCQPWLQPAPASPGQPRPAPARPVLSPAPDSASPTENDPSADRTSGSDLPSAMIFISRDGRGV
jgi:hypothetical protein